MHLTSRARLTPLALGLAAAGVPARPARAQDLQLLYDLRHDVDPRNNPRNFPTVTYQLYEGSAVGGFLLKAQANFDGSRHNVSQGYVEATQTLKFWKPAVFVHLEYTGGLGLFDRATGGYYLDNAYLVGAEHPFRWAGAWASAYAAYRYTNTPKPSHDPQVALYWGRAFGRRWDVASTAVAWTQNRDRGDVDTAALRGKRAALYVENGLWFRCSTRVLLGTRVIISDNAFATDGRLLAYPAVGARFRL